MNHKRRRPKDRRAGCLLCKPHKSNANKGGKPENQMRASTYRQWLRGTDGE